MTTPASENIDISVAICTHNRAEILRNALSKFGPTGNLRPIHL